MSGLGPKALALVVLAGGLPLMVGSCAARGKGGDAKGATEDPQTALDSAERELNALLGPSLHYTSPRPYSAQPPPPVEPSVDGAPSAEPEIGVQPAPAPPRTPSSRPQDEHPRNADGDGLSVSKHSEANVCERVCEALGSMQRASDRLCDLTDDAQRCSSARDRVEHAASRVAERCPTCGYLDG